MSARTAGTIQRERSAINALRDITVIGPNLSVIPEFVSVSYFLIILTFYHTGQDGEPVHCICHNRLKTVLG